MSAVFKKEFTGYFKSIMGYIFIGVFVLLIGIFFVLINIGGQSSDFSYTLNSTSIIFLIIMPILTMRLFAEETRQNTDQLLYTAPLSLGRIVIAKFFAAFALYLIALALTIIFPLSVAAFSPDMPVAKIVGALLGYALLGSCLISVGLMVSALTDNQIIAAVGTFAAVLIFFILDSISNNAPQDRMSCIVFILALIVALALFIRFGMGTLLGAILFAVIAAIACAAAFLMNNAVFDGSIAKILSWVSLMSRFGNFGKGVLNISDIVYYISFTAVFVYLTMSVIERRRWR